jgi:cytochrome c biogenesis protein CcdA
MSITGLTLAFIAGLLSVLSPCVLPILPLVLGAAASAERFGPLALAAGLIISFTLLGLFIATIGFAIGLNAEIFRYIAAILIVTLGLVLTLPKLQELFSSVTGRISNAIDQRFQSQSWGMLGQFGVGLLLGALWSPCVGPTLGAASLLAARSENLPQVAATMGIFSLGAALPLVLLGTISREASVRWRGRMMTASHAAKVCLGAILVVVGLIVLTGIDKTVESKIVARSPAWLTDLTTRF